MHRHTDKPKAFQYFWKMSKSVRCLELIWKLFCGVNTVNTFVKIITTACIKVPLFQFLYTNFTPLYLNRTTAFVPTDEKQILFFVLNPFPLVFTPFCDICTTVFCCWCCCCCCCCYCCLFVCLFAFKERKCLVLFYIHLQIDIHPISPTFCNIHGYSKNV